MNSVKQGMAAVALVASLGCVLPGAFGGSASADPKPGQGTADGETRLLYCDLNGDGSYFDETPYEVISQSNGPEAGFHDVNSSTVLVYIADQRFTRYVPFDDPNAYVDILGRLRGGKGGERIGQDGKVVACQEALQPAGDITACTDATTAIDCPPLIAGEDYHVFTGRTWYVTLSASGQGTVTAAADGKHRGTGKHRH